MSEGVEGVRLGILGIERERDGDWEKRERGRVGKSRVGWRDTEKM